MKIEGKTFRELRKKLRDLMCDHCGGLGEIDDAKPGDFVYQIRTCEKCNGTGLKQ